jgi:hypothetical protein
MIEILKCFVLVLLFGLAAYLINDINNCHRYIRWYGIFLGFILILESVALAIIWDIKPDENKVVF